MAKKGGKSKGAVSKGERKSSISTKNTDEGQKMLNKMRALKKGKDVVWSLPNVSADGKVHPNTRVKVSGKDYISKMKQGGYQQKAVDQ